ncbi:MAG: hypothetical protein MJE77_29265 [Proteobacteria bacterium]|nr:hypothetical protein [Pseudomonadota bacterium]
MARRAEFVLCGVMAFLYVVPLTLTRYFPGSDLPWHAAIVEIMRSPAPEREFLGYFTVDGQFSSYLTLYVTALGLAALVGDTVIAIQLVIAVYVVAFVLAAYYLMRSFGGRGSTAVLAAPAAYSLVLEFGFVTYALTYPMTLALWAVLRRYMAGYSVGRASDRDRHGGWIALCVGFLLAGLIAMTHPFAAAIAVAGVLIVLGTHLDSGRVRRGAVAGLVVLAAMAPAMWAVAALSGDPSAILGGLPAGPMDQQFTALSESLSALPGRLFGYLGSGWAAAILLLGLCAAVLTRILGMSVANASARDVTGARSRALIWLAAALAAFYLVTPFTFEWPRFWYAAQPRLLPLLWVVLLAAIEVVPRTAIGLGRGAGGRPAIRSVWAGSMTVSVLALIVLMAGTFVPFADEAADFRAVITRAAPRSRTLALIEQRRTIDRKPPSPWRNAAAYLLVERHGFVSGLPFTESRAGNAGMLVPVQRKRESPRVPAAPPMGFPRSFDMSRHGPGWTQLLIRDLDPHNRFDYVSPRAVDVRLVVTRGRWRLYAFSIPE